MEQKVQHNLFHNFIVQSANKPAQSTKFIQFVFMEQQIRKAFKQLKKSSNVSQKCPLFADYWKQLNKQTQVMIYSKWNQLLKIAVERIHTLSINFQQQQKQGILYFKRSTFGQWQKKVTYLKNGYLSIKNSYKQYHYPLKYYQIRKSKNKKYYAWVFQIIINNKQKLKSLHCGTHNIQQYQNWTKLFQKHCQSQRIKYFINKIQSSNQIISKINQKQKINKNYQSEHMKTITQMVIQNEMKINNETQILQLQSFKQQQKKQQQYQQQQQQYKQQQIILTNQNKNPNILQKLLPNSNINNLNKITQNSQLLWQQQNNKIYLIKIQNNSISKYRIKLLCTINFNIQLVFKILTQKPQKWNKCIQNYLIKTKISSENSALIYQKNKSEEFLYRSRDYLYLRHCFSKRTDKNQKIYIIDKSIDSVNHPPFMTVIRGQKQLIYELTSQKQNQYNCQLIIQGIIKGGGYMNQIQDKQMTIKIFKKIIILLNQYLFKNQNLLKQSIQPKLFLSEWQVKQQIIYDKKINYIQQNQNNDYNEFLQKTKQIQQKNNYNQKPIKGPSQIDLNLYQPPKFNKQRMIIVPNNYLFIKYRLIPKQKSQQPQWAIQYKNKNIWFQQWDIHINGGLVYIDIQKMKQQKKVLTFIIKSIGKNIWNGKSILNLSLPVDIFCTQSNIQRLAMTFGYAPILLEKASKINQILEQIKYIIAMGISSSLIYVTMEKPFNPIIGQTYQGYIDTCPVYFEQISHHPPIAAYMMIGRGYKITGTLEAKMDISINSGSGRNQGLFTVTFDNGNIFHYTTSIGQLTGLTYGQRKLLMVGKTFYWNIQTGIFLQLEFNPSSKKNSFFTINKKYKTQQQKLNDYFEGKLKKYNPEKLKQFLTQKNGNQYKYIIPKTSPNFNPIEQYYQINGRWTHSIKINNQQFININQTKYYNLKQINYPLPSNSNFRQDIVYRKLNHFVTSQEFKEILEIQQRKDQKLRKMCGNRK